MRFTKLLAATALAGGLALAGAGTAQAETQFFVGPHVTQAECTAVADSYRANYPDIDVSNCAYGTIHGYYPSTGWWFGILQPD